MNELHISPLLRDMRLCLILALSGLSHLLAVMNSDALQDCLIALVQLYQLWVFVIWRTMSSNVEKLLLRWTKGKKIGNYLIPETIGDPLMCSTKTGTVRLHHFVYRLLQRDLQCFYWCNRLKAIMAYLLIALCSASQRCAPSHMCDFVTL